MNKPDLDPLLNDLLAESDYADFRAALKQRALVALRRQRRWRQARLATLSVAAAGAMLWVGQWFAPYSLTREQPSGSRTVDTAEAPVPRPTNALPEVQTISDEQLLASFPPGSCFLAEFDGRAVLIFTDPKLRDEVVR